MTANDLPDSVSVFGQRQRWFHKFILKQRGNPSPHPQEAAVDTILPSDGWQTRIDAALKDWLRTHSPALK